MKNKKICSKEREELILNNIKLVYYLAGKLNVSETDYEDVISMGYIGLVKAAVTYQYTKEVKFATYAAKCINNEMYQYFRKNKKYRENISLNMPIKVDDEGNEVSFEDVISGKDDFIEKIIEEDTLMEIMKVVLNCLQPKEKMVILYKMANIRQSEISKIAHTSQSYISRLERKVEKKIRMYLKDGIKYNEVYKMSKVKNTYQISFCAEDTEELNNILNRVWKKIGKSKNMPCFKLSSTSKQIKITVPACSDSFEFLASIIQEIDNYTLTISSNKNENE